MYLPTASPPSPVLSPSLLLGFAWQHSARLVQRRGDPAAQRRRCRAQLLSTGSSSTGLERGGFASRCSALSNVNDDEQHMAAALHQARLAASKGEVPVGAVLVDGVGRVIAAAHNETLARNSPLAHAEMLCLEAAAQRLGAWRLLDTTLFVTCEPCPMCAGAVYQARLKRLVYGARQPRIGADGSWISMFPGACNVPADEHGGPAANASASYSPNKPHPFHPHIQVTRGVLQGECGGVLRTFFQERRQAAGNSSEDPAPPCQC